MWSPRAQSHDRMCSLVVQSCQPESAAPVATIALPPTQRALLGFALKNYAAGSMTAAVVHREVCNFADTVYSLTAEQRALYGSRIVLYLFAPESARGFWEELRQFDKMIFPLVVGANTFDGAPNARGVKFSELAFDVVVVPQKVADAFLVW